MKIFVYNLTYSLLTMTMMLLAMSMNGFVILTLAFGTALGKTIFHPDSQNIC